MKLECMEPDSHSAIYIYNLYAGHAVNPVMNLTEFTLQPMVLICVETKWSGT